MGRNCSKCGVDKSPVDFYKDKLRADGLMLRCKECVKEKTRQFRADNPGIIRERRKKYDQLYKQTGRRKMLRETDIDKSRAREREHSQKWRELNREKYNNRLRRWRENNIDRRRAHARADAKRRRIANPIPLRDRVNVWRRNNPDRVLASNRARYARKHNAPGSHTIAQWQSLCNWFGDCCVCCGASGKLAADHVKPLIKGGSDSIENLQPLCGVCNSRKYTGDQDYRDPDLLAMFLGGMPNGCL